MKFSHLRLVLSVIVLTAVLGSLETMSAQWSNDPTVNTIVCTAANDQTNPKITGDGAGGAIITWMDNRSGTGNDIYAQRIDATGGVKWTADGVAICAATDEQTNPAIVSDGSGGAVITWQDRRNGSYHIYAQRVNASGAIQWTLDGAAICTASVSQSNPSLISDGSGGAIIAWETNTHNVSAQRINAAGAVQWTVDGVPICTVAVIAQRLPVMVGDGSGGAIFAWGDYRSGTSYDVYTQRIDASGAAQWTTDGVVVSATTNEQSTPAIDADGAGGAVLAWKDYRNGNNDVYAQRINSSGVAQWTANGVAICTAADDQLSSAVRGDNAGGAVIAWKDFRNGTENHIYAQRVDATGAIQWTSDGVAVCTIAGNQYVPVLISDGSTGVEIAWQDNRSSGGFGVYAQRLDVSGAAQWTAGGSQMGPNPNPPAMVSNGSEGAIVTWQDHRSGTNYDIYTQELSSNNVLPVEVVSVSVQEERSSVRIRWTTASEINGYGFEIERKEIRTSNTDIARWVSVGFVVGAGTSASPRQYSFEDKTVVAGQYSYRIKQIDKDGTFQYTQTAEVEVGSTPRAFTLSQNYPNPFNPSTTIEFTLPNDGWTTLKVYDMLGREVVTLVDGELKAGAIQHATFDASQFSSGLYISRLEFGGNRISKKMILIK